MFGSEGHISASFTESNTVDVCQTAEMWPFWLIALDTSHLTFSPPPTLPGEIGVGYILSVGVGLSVSLPWTGHGV